MSNRPEPKCAVQFKNGIALRLLEDYQGMRDRVERAEPGELLEAMAYQDSIDGTRRAIARTSIRASEVDRVDEITNEMLEIEEIERQAAAMAGGQQ